ncbi:hypothetical protein [Enhygromyxa salina]|uniref:Uncharacterized protein n=1 Tax=Enhygromyxa salina TaxID=215803 RepID=A0A2S9YVC1_9BACT|nr:hypothetical protein [Enhygromyxa salina]PRQ09048.1 hypothetical protein ENSA7_10380 [Enhygromyxa salina]
MRPQALISLTLVLPCWLSACASPDADDHGDSHVSHGDTDTDGDSETNADTGTDTTPSTDAETTDTSEPDPEGAQCQADLQDCPEDYKCLLRLGAEDWEFVCLPINGDAEVGESCEHDGVIAGTDSCDGESWCIGPFDPSGAPWSGLCYGLCVGGECDSADRCVGIGSLPVCAPVCDPLAAGSCGPTEACIFRAPEGFVCFPQGAEGNGVGDPCETGASCAAGLHCAQNVAGCGPDNYCCTDYCDTNEAGNTCAAQDMGAVCEAIGASDPTQAHVGACVIPN